MDAMQELGNIGAAHAATTLSQLLSSTVEMSVPRIKTIDIAQLASYIGEESAALVVFELQGENPHGGYIIIYISRKSAVQMTNTMLGLTDPDRPLNKGFERACLRHHNNVTVDLVFLADQFCGEQQNFVYFLLHLRNK